MDHSVFVEKLSDKEKLKLMEELWTSLREPETEFTPPSWHLAELEKRAQQITEKKNRFIDWDMAKKEINHSVK